MSPEQEAPSRETIDRVKRILREELRLEQVSEIGDEAPLFGSDLDLDSLDVLLIVSSIEKAFGVKIPNDEIDQSAFESVTTLSRFVEERCAGAGKPGHDD
jgi:acyl carrier protein